jgi:hypothetical protein
MAVSERPARHPPDIASSVEADGLRAAQARRAGDIYPRALGMAA